MNRRIVPDIVQPTEVAGVAVDVSILDAAKIMSEKRIAALIVTDAENKIIGIVTERDVVFRGVAGELDPSSSTVADIMTANPDTLSPNDSAVDALELMQTRKYRHLPVVEDGNCIAVVSIRDLFASVKESLEESIKETEAFVFGDRYGA